MPRTLQPLNRPTKSRPRQGFGYNVVRLAELVMAQGEQALAPLNLTPREFEAMNCIVNGDGMSQQDLSRRLGLYAPQMVPLIDRLQQRGWVERHISPTDRRRHALSLTSSGWELLKQATQIGENLEIKLFGGVSEGDRSRFEKLIENLETLANQGEGKE